jgi:hypothetical protein
MLLSHLSVQHLLKHMAPTLVKLQDVMWSVICFYSDKHVFVLLMFLVYTILLLPMRFGVCIAPSSGRRNNSVYIQRTAVIVRVAL